MEDELPVLYLRKGYCLCMLNTSHTHIVIIKQLFWNIFINTVCTWQIKCLYHIMILLIHWTTCRIECNTNFHNSVFGRRHLSNKYIWFFCSSKYLFYQKIITARGFPYIIWYISRGWMAVVNHIVREICAAPRAQNIQN